MYQRLTATIDQIASTTPNGHAPCRNPYTDAIMQEIIENDSRKKPITPESSEENNDGHVDNYDDADNGEPACHKQ